MDKERKKHYSEVYSLLPLIKQAVSENARRQQVFRQERKDLRTSVFAGVWGDVKLPFYISPSTASNCLKQAGYEALGYTPAPNTFEEAMSLMMGTADHNGLLRVLSAYGMIEQSLVSERPAISGRLDYLFKNPKTGEWQVMDLKFVGSYGFKMISREALPEELKANKNLFAPSSEARLQTLLYMWQKRKEGLNVVVTNIIYINRDNWDIKESMVVWDVKTELEVEEFLARVKRASEAIERGELPEPSVVSKHVCARFCKFLQYCGYGQKFAKGEIKKKRRKPAPAWARKKAKEEKAAREARLTKQGIIPQSLFNLDEIPSGNKR